MQLEAFEMKATIEYLSQTAVLIDSNRLNTIVNTYLRSSVQDPESPSIKRHLSISYAPNELTIVDWVLVKNEHLGHSDPHNLPIIAKVRAKPNFIVPLPVDKKLESWGIESQRLLSSPFNKFDHESKLKVPAVPATHAEICIDTNNESQTVSIFFESTNHTLDLSDNISATGQLADYFQRIDPTNYSLPPMNADYYLKKLQTIIDNISLGKTFRLATEVEFKDAVSVNWNMFEVAGADQNEVNSIYSANDYPFRLTGQKEVKL